MLNDDSLGPLDSTAGSPSRAKKGTFTSFSGGAAGASFDIIFDTQSQLVKSEIVE